MCLIKRLNSLVGPPWAAKMDKIDMGLYHDPFQVKARSHGGYQPPTTVRSELFVNHWRF